MGTGTRSTIIEIGRSLAVAAIVAGAGTVLLASRLEERVKANQEEARRELAAAVAVRRAEQAAIVQDNEQLKAAVREMLPVLKELSKDSAATKEAMARLEVTVSYLARGQDEIKEQMRGLHGKP